MAKKFLLYTLLFIALLLIGFSMAARKPLWGDEIFSQVATINQSYTDILLLKSPIEGNVSPLFYIQQKFLCDVFRFNTPQEWVQGDWKHTDAFANIFLRILPVLWMSLSLLLLFVFFSTRFNLVVGLFSLCMAFSSKLLLVHWVEARPYGLWVLLTICQMLLFISILEDQKLSSKKRILLFLSHLFLALSCPLSIFQIVTVSAILLYKKLLRYQEALILLIPLVLIYYFKPPHSLSHTVFTQSIPEIIRSVFPMDRMLILLLYPLTLWIYFLKQNHAFKKISVNIFIFKSLPLFVFILLIILEIYGFLMFLQAHSIGTGYIVLGRHIIFLVPVGIIGISYLAGILWENLSRGFWFKFLCALIFILFFLPF